MLKTLLHHLTDRILSKPALPEASSTEESGIDVWRYAEPAGDEPDPLKRNILQWRRLISSVRDPLAEFPGQSVNIIGFVQRTPNQDEQQFTLARPIIRCCLADTVPLGLVIHTDQAAQFEANTWLQIQGRFAAIAVQNKQVLMIEPTTIQPIPEPQKIYINGVF